MQDQILARIQAYTKAVYQLDFKLLVQDFFYKPDLEVYHEMMLFMAEQMEPFGESDNFLKLFPSANTVEDLKKLTMVDFIAVFLSRGVRKIGAKELRQMLKTIKVTDVEQTEEKVIVSYVLKNTYSEEQEEMANQMEMVEVDGKWYVKFRAGMQAAMDVYKKKINDFYERKKKDNEALKNDPEEELERYELHGYQTYDGKPVIEPRFTEAGHFSEGLAFAKVFSKYGYIDRSGEFVIQPRFDKADIFWDGMAKVGMRNGNWDTFYGFIDKKGNQIVPFIYEDANDFSEGLAAVCLDDKWGFINKKGEVVVEIIYNRVNDFDDGVASLFKEQEDGETKVFVIDQKGSVKDSFNEWDEEE